MGDSVHRASFYSTPLKMEALGLHPTATWSTTEASPLNHFNTGWTLPTQQQIKGVCLDLSNLLSPTPYSLTCIMILPVGLRSSCGLGRRGRGGRGGRGRESESERERERERERDRKILVALLISVDLC